MCFTVLRSGVLSPLIFLALEHGSFFTSSGGSGDCPLYLQTSLTHCFCKCLRLVLNTWSLLPQLPKSWDFRLVPPSLAAFHISYNVFALSLTLVFIYVYYSCSYRVDDDDDDDGDKARNSGWHWATQSRMTLNSWYFCFQLPRDGIRSGCHC